MMYFHSIFYVSRQQHKWHQEKLAGGTLPSINKKQTDCRVVTTDNMRIEPYIRVAKKRVLNTIWKYWYRGNQVVCLVCDWQGEKFISGRCPSCDSLPRTRLISYLLKSLNVDLNKKSVLHIAPNMQEYNIIRSKYQTAIYDRLDLTSRPIMNLIQDLTKLDIVDETYDFIISWHVMEHIPEDTKAIKEMYRVLKPGAELLLSVPIHPIGRTLTYEDKTLSASRYLEVHGHHDHCRSCGLDYYQKFELAGFRTTTIEVKDYGLPEINRYGLKPGHVAWLFKK
jgi:SAM-dependent methyltransferase